MMTFEQVVNELRSYDKEKVWLELNQTQVRILAEIRNNPNITKVRLMELLGLGKTTIDNGLSVLKKCGYIERVGSRKAGYWKVNED